ncbi:MAG: Spy/CpxP family protein refolding chaperone [Pseudolabrys sp.]|nr:Spy/CpxP family protein refolding chaperone [Pseudolabrys sp.]MDP2295993.1 Spy/CpxP family protein refolding chaperone [Pseudolabrys sp.]
MTTIKRSTLLKTLLAGTTALAIAGTTFAYAQGPGRGHERGPHARMSAEDITAYGDARIAAIRAGLKLTPEQEKNWPAVEAALRDMAKQRSERFAARASADKPSDPIERLSARADAMTQQGATLKKLADAAGPLYKTLDDGQKSRLMVLAKLGGRDGHGMRGRQHGGPGKHHGGPRGGERGPMGPDGPAGRAQ